jgi:hypothetical protein
MRWRNSAKAASHRERPHAIQFTAGCRLPGLHSKNLLSTIIFPALFWFFIDRLSRPRWSCRREIASGVIHRLDLAEERQYPHCTTSCQRGTSFSLASFSFIWWRCNCSKLSFFWDDPTPRNFNIIPTRPNLSGLTQHNTSVVGNSARRCRVGVYQVWPFVGLIPYWSHLCLIFVYIDCVLISSARN